MRPRRPSLTAHPNTNHGENLTLTLAAGHKERFRANGHPEEAGLDLITVTRPRASQPSPHADKILIHPQVSGQLAD